MSARTDYDGYGITELRQYARELNIPGRSTMTGPQLLTAVRGSWNARRVAAERQVMPAVRPGAYLRFKSHTDCVIKVTSHIIDDTSNLALGANQTRALYVEAEYVSMCANCDHGRNGGPVTARHRMDYHNTRAVPYRFLLWTLEPASATQTADAMQRETSTELRPGDLVARADEPTGLVLGTVARVGSVFAFVRFGGLLSEYPIRKAHLTKVDAGRWPTRRSTPAAPPDGSVRPPTTWTAEFSEATSAG